MTKTKDSKAPKPAPKAGRRSLELTKGQLINLREFSSEYGKLEDPQTFFTVLAERGLNTFSYQKRVRGKEFATTHLFATPNLQEILKAHEAGLVLRKLVANRGRGHVHLIVHDQYCGSTLLYILSGELDLANVNARELGRIRNQFTRELQKFPEIVKIKKRRKKERERKKK
jgi:hypothetical protein